MNQGDQNQRRRFFGDEDGEEPMNMERAYKTGASESFGPGTQKKVFFKWCLPSIFCMATTVSVCVRVKIDDPAAEHSSVDLAGVFGTLIWGSGQGDGPDCQEMDFDCVGGASFSVEAYQLQVAMTYTPSAPSTPVINPVVHVDVSVSIGSAGKAGPSPSGQRTILVNPGVFNGGGNASADFAIPLYAVGARIVTTDLDSVIPSLDLIQLKAAAGAVVSTTRPTKFEVGAVPIARGLGARFFRVQNNNAAAAHDVAVIFDLCPT